MVCSDCTSTVGNIEAKTMTSNVLKSRFVITINGFYKRLESVQNIVLAHCHIHVRPRSLRYRPRIRDCCLEFL